MYIPLSKAVAQAHRRLFPDEPQRNPRTLQTIALALTALVPIYRCKSGCELTEPELAGERFSATSLDELMVSTVRFEAALESMQIQSLEQARASLTMRQSPRAFNVLR